MQRLFFDTETTGLWDFNSSTSAPNQPKLVQLGAVLEGDDGKTLAEVDLLVTPNGWTIPAAASNVHHITTELAHGGGVSIANACFIFRDLVANADVIVAHNLEFDLRVMTHNLGISEVPEIPWHKVKQACTKLASTPIVKALPFKKGSWKWPSLEQAHMHFFGTGVGSDAHNAMVDVQACRRVYHELRKMGAVE